MSLRLDCRPHSDLRWEIPEGELFLEFELGLTEPFFPLEEELRFQALSLALTKFTQEIWPQVSERTRGGMLYCGSADFSRHFLWTQNQEENFAIWKEGRGSFGEAHLKRLFCAEAFVAYFQMLAHRLPDELSLQLSLSADGCGTLAERYHLLSPDRFDHFLLAIEGLPKSDQATVGICLPENCSEGVLQKIDQLLQQQSSPCRVIPEALLTEFWEGLDELLVFSDTLTERGKRKLKGFSAACGKIIYL